jgi:general secretion pathway protein H
MMALLAAILLPRMPGGTSRSQLEAYAIEAASMLVLDRHASMLRHVRVSTGVDAPARLIQSGSNGRVLRIPRDVIFDAVLPRLCNRHVAFSAIEFLPSGRSCGGTIVLTRLGMGYEVRVNWLTGGVEIVPHGTL